MQSSTHALACRSWVERLCGNVGDVEGDASVFIRRDTKKNGSKRGKGRAKKGTTYLSIAHNVREETDWPHYKS